MKEKWSKLNVYYKVAILTFSVSLILFVLLIELFFININGQTWGEVPLGILVGGALGALMHFLEGIAFKAEEKKGTANLSIAVTSLRFIVFAGIIILDVLMYYRWNIKIFNVFGIVGGYTIAIVTLVIAMLKEKK